GNINNFLAAKYLWNEQNLDYKEVFSMDEADFFEQLDKNQKSFDSLYTANSITNEDFKEKLSVEDKYSRAIMLENYQEAHRYYNGKTDFKVSESFYEELKNVNYTDTLAYRHSVAYQSLLDAHFNRLAAGEAAENGNV